MEPDKIRKNDLWLIAVLLLLCLLFAAGSLIRSRRRAAGTDAAADARIAVVSVDGEEVLRIRLSDGEVLYRNEDHVIPLAGDAAAEQGSGSSAGQETVSEEEASARNFRIETAEGYNLLTVSGDRIRCSEADCPDRICVETGAIGTDTETIVCLPHRLIVQVLS